LDLSRLKSIEPLNRALKKTLKFIKEKLGDDISPTVLWTGNGYHIYTRYIDVIVVATKHQIIAKVKVLNEAVCFD